MVRYISLTHPTRSSDRTISSNNTIKMDNNSFQEAWGEGRKEEAVYLICHENIIYLKPKSPRTPQEQSLLLELFIHLFN